MCVCGGRGAGAKDSACTVRSHVCAGGLGLGRVSVQ